ncbi:unnamed protein product [Candidula unifasciata]|uniref:Peptidase M20 domain-containing protein 2 n=1 Tax=Candidula unifasciata TaxID=100452 RepID=A0A8S3YZ97_9EUPU|nr:unnamed protein product [Candidula unifasciata]
MKEKEPYILSSEKKIAFTAIEQQQHELNRIAEDLWRYSEPPGKEVKSHDLLVDFLRKKGFKVKQRYMGMPTAFKAEFVKGESREHPNIGFLCQYDTGKSTNHSRGHNLSTVVSITAALGLQTFIKFANESVGMITVIGCPGDAENTGKITMFDAGGFKGLDFILVAYPANYTNVQPNFVGSQTHRVTFRGRNRIDGDRPWEVANPVNAVVLAYQNVAAIRQQFKSSWVVKGVISEGGRQPDIMPQKACMEFLLKVPKPSEMKILGELLHRCFEGAATATGCRFEVEPAVREFLVNVTSNRLSELYQRNAALMGFTFHNVKKDMEDEDDIANVSTAIPTLKVFYYAATPAILGTEEFARFAGSKECQFMSILQGKALAMTGIDLMMSEDNMKEIFEEHQADFVRKYEGIDDISVDPAQE